MTVNIDLIEKIAAGNQHPDLRINKKAGPPDVGPAGNRHVAMMLERTKQLDSEGRFGERQATNATRQIFGLIKGQTKKAHVNIDLINDLAGVKTAAGNPDAPARYQGEVSTNLINDLIKGAAQNPRLTNVELGGALSNGGFTQFDIAKTAGMLVALSEAEYTVKEACEALNLNEDTLQAIVAVTK